MGDNLGMVKAAVIQAAPCFLDREETLHKSVRLIEEAGALGAEVIVFPESFIPAHPVLFHFHAATSPTGLQMAAALLRNSVVVGGHDTHQLAEAVKRAGATVMGVCEKRPETTDTTWNSAIHFATDGTIACVHRKLTPTVGERLVHTGGDGSGLEVPRARFGAVSTLICAETFNPLFGLLRGRIVLRHPRRPVAEPLLPQSIPDARRHPHRLAGHRLPNGCYVLNAASTLDREGLERVARDNADRKWLNDERNLGGSRIVAPNGETLAGPGRGGGDDPHGRPGSRRADRQAGHSRLCGALQPR